MKNLSKFEMNAVMGGRSSESAYKKAYEKAKTSLFACKSEKLIEIEDYDTPL